MKISRVNRARGAGRLFFRSVPLIAFTAGLPMCLTTSSDALAGVTFSPYAAVRYENNSNVFALSDADAAAQPGPKGDSTISYLGGFDSAYEWSRQKFAVNFVADRVNFSHYKDELDHNEFGLNTELDWQFMTRLDGVLGYQQQRRMASFADKNTTKGSRVSIEDGRTGTVSLGVLATSWLRLEPVVKYHDVTSPQTDVADFGVTEKIGGLGIKYVGYSRLSIGVEGEYLDGRYRGTRIVEDPNNPGVIIQVTPISELAPPYRQKTARFAATYNLSGFSLFSLAVGYTARDEQQITANNQTGNQNNANNTHATTGALSYERQLTGKTSMNLQISREVNNYLTAGSSEIDTGAAIQVTWQATGKTAVLLHYAYTKSVFGEQLIQDPNLINISTGREDKAQLAELNITYDMLRWFSIRPFVRYQKRASNLDIFSYKSTEFGVELRATYPK